MTAMPKLTPIEVPLADGTTFAASPAWRYYLVLPGAAIGGPYAAAKSNSAATILKRRRALGPEWRLRASIVDSHDGTVVTPGTLTNRGR